MIDIRLADLSAMPVRMMIRQHIDHGNAHYPEESNHHLEVDEYAGSGVVLFAAWAGEDCLGMVGMKHLGDGQVELKSMHVSCAARGRGLGAALIEKVLDVARAEGGTRMLLETGSKEGSAAARGLYEKHGFAYCPPFGGYALDPESVFMHRTL